MKEVGARPLEDGWTQRFGRRLRTVAELLAVMAGHRPWLTPLLVGLLLMTGVVSLAQATHIAPFIYTLF